MFALKKIGRIFSRHDRRVTRLNGFRLLILVLGCGFSACAATIVVPNANTATNGNQANQALLQDSPRTMQLVYAANQLSAIPVGQAILGIAFRLHTGQATWPPADRTWSSYDIQVSTSNFAPGLLDNTFANNIGPDVITVRSGPLTITPGSLIGGTGLNPFGFVIPFTAPFTYTGGNLLITIRHTGNGVDAEFLDSNTNNATGEMITAGSYTSTSITNGSLSSSDPIVQLTVGPATATQTITFGPLNNVPSGAAPFAINATASSGLPVTFASNTVSVCTVSGNTVTIVSSGTCSIIANQPGNANYAPAPSVTQSFAVQTALRFVAITPCRLVDTRNPAGAFGGPSITGQTSRDFIIPNGSCQIPTSALAYSLNVAVVPQGPLGFLTIWPAGGTQPLVATLNSDGRVKSNAAIVNAGNNGAISVFATNTTDLVLDINGYFVPATNNSALAFYPVTPCRIADTRLANGPLGGPFLTGQVPRTFPILSSSCGVPGTAQAYSLNFAAVPHGPLGFLTAWPTGQAQPFVASLNAPTGTVTANAAIVPAGTSGSIDIFATNNTDLVIDINGYFAPAGAGGLSLYGVPPCRVLDTRLPAGTPPFSGTMNVNVTASGCGTPASASAFVFNATVVPSGGLGFLTLWPQGTTQPSVASLNALDGAVTGNMAIVPTNNGSISAFATNTTHLVLDIFGYFAP
jgi:hypothetical protein